MEDASRSNLLTPLSFLDASFLLLLFLLVWIVSNIHLACALDGLMRLVLICCRETPHVILSPRLTASAGLALLTLLNLRSSLVLSLSTSEVHQLGTVATARTGFTFTLPNCLSPASSAGLPIP